MRIFNKFLIFIITLILLVIGYLSFFGFETKRFNQQIISKIKNIDDNLGLELKEIKIILNPFKMTLNAKTIGPIIKINKKKLEIENIKTQIPIRSLFNKNNLIENLEISTNSIEVKSLISIIRIFYNKPEFFILEKIIKKGYLIADINVKFEKDGSIKNDFEINGFIKDIKIDDFKKFKINNLNFIFNYKQNILAVNDINLNFNNLNLTSKKLKVEKMNNEFLVEGEIENENLFLDEKNLKFLENLYLPDFEINKIGFNSTNKFSFSLNNKFKLDNFKLKSYIQLSELILLNVSQMEEIFSQSDRKVKLKDHKIELDYMKNHLTMKGKGIISLKKNNENIIYSIKRKNKLYDFIISLKIKESPFIIEIFDYKKIENQEVKIDLKGSKKLDGKTKFDLISLREQENLIELKGLTLDKNLKIIDLNKANFDYYDTNKVRNKYQITSQNKIYHLFGLSFNADNLINNLIEDKSQMNIINKDFKLKIEIDKLVLDSKNSLNNFKGKLSFNNQKLINGNLIGNFSNNKKFKFTVKSDGNQKITTLFFDKAEPVIRRYKFIKGFDGGILDFYSKKNDEKSISTLKIYDFKLSELPVLTKLLTLASLQGIADLLSGEGIRFNEFEMNFKNNKNLMTIDEIYAIGPAISILMNGYIEKDKLVSLRGTLVPATTLNKLIGSIPLFGDILVGKKVGEGVFGVSFKIKGSPQNLETTVNPIKTLTPRFITRTLEKIKKN